MQLPLQRGQIAVINDFTLRSQRGHCGHYVVVTAVTMRSLWSTQIRKSTCSKLRKRSTSLQNGLFDRAVPNSSLLQKGFMIAQIGFKRALRVASFGFVLVNMIGHANHAVALGNFLEGRVWIEDENGQATTVLETKMDRSCFMERGSTCMMLQLRSMLGNIVCKKSIAETCELLQHKLQAFKHAAASHINKLSNLAFQFLSYGKHSNCVIPTRACPSWNSTDSL